MAVLECAHPLLALRAVCTLQNQQDSARSMVGTHYVDEHVELGLVAPAELGAQRLVALGVVEHLLRDISRGSGE